MRTAQSTALHSDQDYVRLLDAQSRWPYGYVMTNTQPTNPVKRAIDGQATVYVGARQVDQFNKLLPVFTRNRMRASQHRPQTELFGTAPYVAVGRGHLRNIDASNTVHFGMKPTHMNMPRRILVERIIERPEYLDIKPTANDMRMGVQTRVGPQYVRPGVLNTRPAL